MTILSAIKEGCSMRHNIEFLINLCAFLVHFTNFCSFILEVLLSGMQTLDIIYFIYPVFQTSDSCTVGPAEPLFPGINSDRVSKLPRSLSIGKSSSE